MTLIQSLLIFYPLIVPVWEAGPFDNHNIDRAESLDFLTTPEIQFQMESLKVLKDPRLRSRIAIDLIDSNNPEAIKGLTFFYELEKIDSVKADILTVLYKMKHIEKCANSSMLKACLKNDNVIIRSYGTALYLDKTKDASPVLNLLKNEKALFVKNLLWNDLKTYYKESPEDLLKELLNSTDPLTRAGAARQLAMKVDNPDADSSLKKAVSDKSSIVRAYLAEGLAQRVSGGAELLATLAKDVAVPVRAFAASAKPAPARVNMHIALSADPDSEVRRLAVVAFRYYKEPAAIDALLKAMNDSFKPTRTAAEDSLIYMKATPAILERVGKEYLEQKPAVYSAVRVLGTLNDQRFNAKIEEILNSATDTDLMRRAINALCALDYKKASGSVDKKATCQEPLVREAVGNALGVLNIKDTFDTLVKLSDDKDRKVTLAAIKGMGVTKDPYFINCLMGVAKDVKRASTRRAFSYWSMARINQPSSGMVSLLKRNILKKIIPIPMSPPDYDTDFARISAVMALIEFSKKDSAAKKAALVTIATLKTPSSQQGTEFISGETLQEYARQAELYMQGKTIEKVPLPTSSPVLTVKKYVKNKRF